MYTEATNQRQGDVARLISPPFVPDQSTQTVCWRFYYHMFGDEMGTLRVKVFGDPNILWSMSSNFGDQWFLGEVEHTSQTAYQMVFEGEIGIGDRSDMAIDHISKIAGPCPAQGSCDFERDTCTWSNRQDDLFDWVRLNSGTASQYTGPSADHTCGVSGFCAPGFFLYIETSSPRVPGDYARLASSFLTPGQDFCMTFWYHMYGVDIGELLVLKSTLSSEAVIWFLSGQQSTNSTDWKYGQVGVTDSNPFQVMFEGVVGKSFAGDIAIDDVLFLPGLCNAFPTIADPTQYGFNATCDFEASLCSWQQARDDQFDWTRYQGSTPSVDTGPSGDHTTGSGYYIYTEASSPRLALERARITTRTLNPTSLLGNCLSFWYHMTGSSMGTLNLFMTSLANGTDTTLWSKTREQDGDWLLGQRTIRSDQAFTITFEGIIGSNFYSDIALDDIIYTQGPCPPPRECDFELDFCEWEQVSSIDDFDWTRPRGVDIHPGQGTRLPDKTTGSSTGHFAYIDETARQAGDTATLVNPNFPAIPDGECLRFWYYVHGIGVGSLKVFQYFPNTTSLGARMWGKSGDQGDQWRLGRVTLQANLPFLAAFVGTVGSTGQGDVAIDDVEVTIGPCPLAGYCDFEDGFCSWTNEGTLDDLDFVRGSGTTDSLETGPSFDHTKGTTEGHYVFLETSGFLVGQEAWLVSEHLDATQGDCFMLWYHMYGQGVKQLDVYQQDPDTQNKILLQSVIGNQGDAWYELAINVTSPLQPYQMVIVGVVGFNYTSDIAVDDISVQPGFCGVPSPYDCNFEQGLCSYTQSQDDDFDWTRSQGSTSSVDTGPSSDHTTDTAQGWYLYIETSSPRVQNDRARLESNLIARNRPVCVEFWYHMYGADIDTLNVFVRPNGTSLGQPLWSKSGTLDDQWYLGQFPVSNSGPYQIIYEGIVGGSYQADIAIDDLALYDGECKGAAVCTFQEDSVCGYQQDTTDDFDWTQLSGPTPSQNTGPTSDATYGTAYGRYMYAEATGQSAGDVSRLLSPVFTPGAGVTDVCWKFSYHMFGPDMGTLAFWPNGDSNPSWSVSGDNGNQWVTAQVNIQRSSPYRVVFQATRGNGELSDVAIDDVNYVPSACQVGGSCNFEDDICTWRHSLDGVFQWLRSRGITPSTLTGPSVDHTTSSGLGYYIYTEASSPRVVGDNAILESQVYSPTDPSSGTCFTFWYNMYGLNIGDLVMYQVKDLGGSRTATVLWTLIGQQSTSELDWRYGQFPVTSDEDYQILIEGIIGADYTGDIAVDDILITNGTCTIQFIGVFE
ncbi:MAM and LDL-receptor class A domain-containing protein 2-like [Acanthaster planci]|uniref:MAM and LDL-receptor class A domain-containing protein 2-like n=1 Tax=Acanthaster planci TaxID=133434 RepID=A0A8B7YYK9_ACAPL|nr:MAM and LDL-receptor class A domain-containing protein 2-like [Acanthaster planci]